MRCGGTEYRVLSTEYRVLSTEHNTDRRDRRDRRNQPAPSAARGRDRLTADPGRHPVCSRSHTVFQTVLVRLLTPSARAAR
jgi:hypothetical protein